MHHNRQAVPDEALPDDQKMYRGSKRLLLVVFRGLPDEKEHGLAVALVAQKKPWCGILPHAQICQLTFSA